MCHSGKDNKILGSESPNGLLDKQTPAYRKNIKSSFVKNTLVSANETIIVALIDAGKWGAHIILQAMETDKNVRVKYVCDVDDTCGGGCIAEIEKIQGY